MASKAAAEATRQRIAICEQALYLARTKTLAELRELQEAATTDLTRQIMRQALAYRKEFHLGPEGAK